MRPLLALAILASAAAQALDLEKYIAATSYIFDLNRTAAVERALRESLASPRDELRRHVEWMMQLHDDLARMPVKQRQTVRELLRYKALGEQRKKAAQGDADATWLVGEFDRQHPAIAMADPPLTHETAAAYFDMLQYVASPLADGGREPVIAKIAAEYPGMTAAVRDQIQMVPAIMALVRNYAPSIRPDELESLRQGIRMRYCPASGNLAGNAARHWNWNAVMETIANGGRFLLDELKGQQTDSQQDDQHRHAGKRHEGALALQGRGQ
jgi:hypothetical protein